MFKKIYSLLGKSLFLLSLLLTNQVCAQNNVYPPGRLKTIDVIPPMIYQKAYTKGQEQHTFGPCDQLDEDTTLCCSIKPQYVVECCKHKKNDLSSLCTSFDPVGILGDRTASKYDTGNYDLLKEIKRYNAQSHTSDISKEADTLLVSRNVQNTNDTLCTIETFGTNRTKNKKQPYPSDELFPLCQVNTASINHPEALPEFTKMINLLAKKHKLATKPTLFVLDDYHPAHCKYKGTLKGMLWKNYIYHTSPSAGPHLIKLLKTFKSCLNSSSIEQFMQLSEDEVIDCRVVLDKKTCVLPTHIKASFSYLNLWLLPSINKKICWEYV